MNRAFITFFLINLIQLSFFAQDSTITRDFETWSSIGAQKALLDKKLTVELQQQFRVDENSSRLHQYFTELGASYEVIKNVKICLGYRFIKDGNKNKGFLSEHRWNFDLGYGNKFDQLKLNYRFRFQKRSNATYSEYPTTKYRLRIKADYNIKKWKFDPFFAAEIFYSKETSLYSYDVIAGKLSINEISNFQKFRLQIGTTYDTGKIGSVKLYYMLQHQFKNYGTNYGIPINWSILGVSYTFKF